MIDSLILEYMVNSGQLPLQELTHKIIYYVERTDSNKVWTRNSCTAGATAIHHFRLDICV